MKGYKVFNSDWTCRGFQYEIGKTYEIDEKPIICERGFHFCKNLKDCFYYYSLREDIKIAEVEMLGDFDINNYYKYTSKICTNKIKILREIHFKDLIITTAPRTYTYATNCYFSPVELEAFIKKNYNIIDGDIFVRDSVKVISIDREELEDEPLGWFSYRIPPLCYKYTFEYQKIMDIEEKPIMER